VSGVLAGEIKETCQIVRAHKNYADSISQRRQPTMHSMPQPALVARCCA
jgi:hypothetical protein